ncbi:MAG: EF-hand domain-containing protein [Planctomycetaceae bacterium]
MSRHAISSLAAALAIIATPALAQNSAGGDAFKKYDTNGDGRIAADELPNRQALQKFDSNGDGVITRDEFGGAGQGMGRPGMAGGQVESLVKAADKDGDGRITRAEAGDASWFDKVDRNEDDVLDAGELNVLRDAMEKKGAGR